MDEKSRQEGREETPSPYGRIRKLLPFQKRQQHNEKREPSK
jgi:hypothetical protein